jgi:hypothetical protein
MSITAPKTTPASTGLITHATALVRRAVDADVSVYHARTDFARIAVNWGGVLITLFSAAAAQGLLEAFAAARQAVARVPREIPPPTISAPQFARPIVAMEFTYRPTYVVVPQSATARSGDRTIHWVDLHTGPITWQIRDQVGLRSAIALLTHVHRTAIAVCLDGERYSDDPTGDDYVNVAASTA